MAMISQYWMHLTEETPLGNSGVGQRQGASVPAVAKIPSISFSAISVSVIVKPFNNKTTV